MGAEDLTASLEKAVRLLECERAQVANEIHDGLLPLLFASSASLANLIERPDNDIPEEVRDRLTRTLAWIDDARAAGRRLMTETYPPELRHTAWTQAAKDTAMQLLGDLSQRISWQLDANVDRLSDPLAFAAYRIVVESIRNALMHGEATEVVITANQTDKQFELNIDDNGCGFDPAEPMAGRFGIRSMIGRAQLVGGRLSIDSKPGGPTKIHLVVPIVG